MKERIRKYILSLRKFRVWHRLMGTTLSLFLFISAVTGIFLALKKEFPIIQPTTQKGESTDLADWKSLATLNDLAQTALIERHPAESDNEVSRMDVQMGKGIVKANFEKRYWEVQLDGKTGAVLSIGKRHSDWIESLHDGSIISDGFKLVSMNFLGLGVLGLIITGLWLWYGPKYLRKIKK